MCDACARDPETADARVDAAAGAVITRRKDGTDLTSYPDNLQRALQEATTDAERQVVLDRFIASAFEMLGDTPPDPAALMPVLRPPEKFAGQINGPSSAPFPGPLEMYFVPDAPNGAAFVTDAMRETLALGPAAMQARVIANLRARDWQVQGGGPYLVVVDGYFESAMLLEAVLWAGTDAQIGQVVVGPLARDVLLFADADRPDMPAVLRQIVDTEFAKMPNALTAEALMLRDGMRVPFALP